MGDIPSMKVPSEIIQRLFNDADYVGKVRNALLYQLVRRCRAKDPDREPRDEPPGTRSQVVEYFDRHGTRIAVVHQYVRPDGSLGASGKPDPKYLLHEGTLYVAERKQSGGA
jgi:hypothetical protein